MKRITAFLCALVLLLSGLSVYAQPEVDSNGSQEHPAWAEGEAIVCMESFSSREQLTGVLAHAETLMTVENLEKDEGITTNALEGPQQILLVKEEGMSTEDLIAELRTYPQVSFAEPNYLYSIEDEADTKGSDVNLEQQTSSEYKDMTEYQWAYHNVGQQSGLVGIDMNIPNWNQQETGEPGQSGSMGLEGKPAVVVVVDTGIDYNHPDLVSKMWHKSENAAWSNLPGGEYGYSPYENGKADVMDVHSHGTHCAGIIGAQWDGRGTSGAGEKLRLMAVKVLNDDGYGSSAAILKGMEYVKQACKAGVNIKAANFSLGSSVLSEAENLAILELGKLGVVSCMASGNDGKNLDFYGSSSSSLRENPYAVVVNALNSDGSRALFSNYSDSLTDVYAPGVGILSTVTLKSSRYSAELDAAPLIYQDFEEETAPFTWTDSEGVLLPIEQGAAFQGTHSISIPVGDQVKSITTNPVQIPEKQDCYISAHIQADDQAMVIAKWYVKAKDGSWIPVTQAGYDGIAYENMWGSLSAKLPAETNFEQFQIQLKMQRADRVQKSCHVSVDCIGAGTQAVPYQYYNGTSMATPAATAEAALLASWIDEPADQTAARVIGGVKRTAALAGTCISGGYLSLDQVLDPYPVIQSAKQENNQVVLKGHFFGDVPATAIVDGRKAEIVSWSESQVTIKLPDGAGTGKKKLELTTASGKMGYTYKQIQTNYYQQLSVPQNEEFKTTAESVLIALKDKLYYIGNQESVEMDTQIWQYDLEKEQWIKLDLEGSPLEESSIFSACAWEGKLAITAVNGDGISKLLLYNPDNGEWQVKDVALPFAGTLVNCQGKLYSVGGMRSDTGEGMTDIIEVNPYDQTIRTAAHLETGRFSPSVTSVGNQVVIVGGYTKSLYRQADITTVEIFCGDKCSRVPDIYPPYTENEEIQIALGATKGGVIAAGTTNPSSISDTSILSLSDLKAGFVDQQMKISSSKIFAPAGVSYKGRFYVIGNNPLTDDRKVFACMDVEALEEETGDLIHKDLYPAGVTYQSHIQNIGWQEAIRDGALSGTTGKSLRIEAVKISLDALALTGDVIYSSHVQNVGWQDWVRNGEMSGTTGKGLRMEAIRIQLTGEMAKQYHIQYRVHVQNIGWQDWVEDGQTAGTTGSSLRAEALEIRLVKK